MIKEYIKYLKDNPKHYWFRAKWFGWGWVPATWEGWMVILVYIALLLLLTANAHTSAKTHDAFLNIFVPVNVLTAILLVICIVKGERPHWSWGRPAQAGKPKKKKR